MLLQLEETQNQVPEGGHGIGGGASADLRGIFAQTDIPAVVRAVLASRPMAANGFQQLLSAVLFLDRAGVVETVLFEFFDDLALAEFLLFAPDGDKLAAAAQAGLFRADADALQAPACQPPMFLVPARIIFLGKKKLPGV